MRDESSTEDRFVTPADLCERWNVDPRTLAKFALPWVRLRPRTRRLELAIVLDYERRNRLFPAKISQEQPSS